MATLNERTMGATEFKAKCLNVMDRLQSGELGRVTVTKHGRPWAMMAPVGDEPVAPIRFADVHGAMENIPAPFDTVLPDNWSPLGVSYDAAMHAHLAEKFKDVL